MGIKKILASALTAGMMLSFIPATAMADSTGWKEEDYGWRYYTSGTEYVKNAWKEIGGYWYYFYDDGYTLTNTWAMIDGKVYHFDAKGHMEKNKWVERGYLGLGYDANGNWLEDETKPGWGYVGSNGAAYSGWQKINGSWYFFGDSNDEGYYSEYGVMYAGMRSLNDGCYYFGENGKMRSNFWYKDDTGHWFYFDSNGKAVEGWKKINNKWYYFDPFGYYGSTMSTGVKADYDSEEWSVWAFENDGTLTTRTGWFYDYGEWYYVKGGGECCRSEWVKSNGKWYYFGVLGKMMKGQKNVVINGKAYDFDSNGVCTNPDSGRTVKGWLESYNDWYEEKGWVYADKNGKLYEDQWLTYGGSKYYFDYDGFMVAGEEEYRVDGRLYSFDKDGKSKDITGNKTGWSKINGYDVYIESDGKLAEGWKQINGKWYLFDEYNGAAARNGFYYWWGDTAYIFNEKCEMVTGWYQYEDQWFYAGKDGNLVADKWIKSGSSWYYLSPWCSAADYEHYVVDGYVYNFDSNGKCLNPDNPDNVIILWQD